MKQDDSMNEEKSREYMSCAIFIFLARTSKHTYEYKKAKEYYQKAISSVKKFVKNGDYNQIKLLIKLYIEYLLIR